MRYSSSASGYCDLSRRYCCIIGVCSALRRSGTPNVNGAQSTGSGANIARTLTEARSMTFRLYSDDLKEGDSLTLAQVFNGFGHSGSNLSPHLAWSDPPAGTRSFVVTMYDPDAPTG